MRQTVLLLRAILSRSESRSSLLVECSHFTTPRKRLQAQVDLTVVQAQVDQLVGWVVPDQVPDRQPMPVHEMRLVRPFLRTRRGIDLLEHELLHVIVLMGAVSTPHHSFGAALGKDGLEALLARCGWAFSVRLLV